MSIIKFLIDNCDIEVNAVSATNRTALYYACHNGHIDSVRLLLACGADKSGITMSDITEMPMNYSLINNCHNTGPGSDLRHANSPQMNAVDNNDDIVHQNSSVESIKAVITSLILDD